MAARRWISAAFPRNCLVRMLLLPRFDLVIALTSPPLISALGAFLVRLKGGKFLYWVMDLNPDQAIAARLDSAELPHGPAPRPHLELQPPPCRPSWSRSIPSCAGGSMDKGVPEIGSPPSRRGRMMRRSNTPRPARQEFRDRHG